MEPVTVTKKELAYRIAAKLGFRKVVVKRIIQQFIVEIINELERGNRLEFREFGVFEIKSRAARKARNPRICVTLFASHPSVSIETLTTQHEATQQLLRGLPEDRARPLTGRGRVERKGGRRPHD